jgi:hypothetical protein
MSPVRRIVASILGAMALAPVAILGVAPSAGAGPREAEDLALHAYSLRYQQAIEAVPLIQPLLSAKGTLELQPGSNTLVVRDTQAALNRIIPVLRAYDHPSQPLRLDVMIVKASRAVVSPQARSDLPEELTRRLRELLPYEVYELQAQTQLLTREGEAVAYNVGSDYEVSFRLGTLMSDRRVKLGGFEVGRRLAHRAASVPMIHTNLNLWLEQTLSLGLARGEASRDALIIVLTLHRGDAQKRPE